jgi:hypothetical protein
MRLATHRLLRRSPADRSPRDRSHHQYASATRASSFAHTRPSIQPPARRSRATDQFHVPDPSVACHANRLVRPGSSPELFLAGLFPTHLRSLPGGFPTGSVRLVRSAGGLTASVRTGRRASSSARTACGSCSPRTGTSLKHRPDRQWGSGPVRPSPPTSVEEFSRAPSRVTRHLTRSAHPQRRLLRHLVSRFRLQRSRSAQDGRPRRVEHLLDIPPR